MPGTMERRVSLQDKLVVLGEDPDQLKLKKNIYLAYTDIGAVGSRALLGLAMGLKHFTLEVPELEDLDLRPACVHGRDLAATEREFQPLLVLNCKYEEFSAIVVNTVVPADRSHHVANRLVDLCTHSGIEKLTILTSLRVDLPSGTPAQPLYENCFNCQPVMGYSALPDNTVISDAFLSCLLQSVQVEGLATSCLTIPGHKALLGTASEDDGTKQGIELFQQTISKWTRLRFDTELSNSLEYKGKNLRDLDMASMIYA